MADESPGVESPGVESPGGDSPRWSREESSGSTSSFTRTSKKAGVNADFIREHSMTQESETATLQEKIRRILKSYAVVNLMAFVVAADSFLTCASVDARAATTELPYGFFFLSKLCLSLYTAELLLAFCANGLNVCKEWLGLIDTLIVVGGWAEVIVAAAVHAEIAVPLGLLRIFRLLRIVRAVQLLRRVRMFRELYKLITMMASVFRTLLWSFLLCFIVMTAFAMLIVEFVNPIVIDLNENFGTFEDCKECLESTATVMEANLLLFQTVIAGDSWGQIAVPVIHAAPATAMIFVGSQLTLVFGVLNLIVAVVVDTFAEARQSDVEALAEDLESDLQTDREKLREVFHRIDKSGTGELSLSELIAGAKNDAVFRSRLRVMDIDENDLQQLFQMIDIDESGSLQVSEFIGPLSRWARDSKTAPRFIKYNLMQSMQMQEDLLELSDRRFTRLSTQLETLANQLSAVTGGESEPEGLLMPTSSGDDSFNTTASSSHDQISAPHASGHPELLESKDSSHFALESQASLPVDIDDHDCHSRRAPTLATHSSEISRKIEAAMAHIDAKLETLLHREEERHRQPQRLARGHSKDTFRVMYMEQPWHVNGGGKPRSKDSERTLANI
ncbi:unnamed protein product [Effrenium voratum]|uniref:EF-hand domain-containing protein n=2 Tax=Effrenium voratum TaxID=2562239 RepID=A0AA36HSY5_9DINO|nr:unnamed protein product [Effrenium voratum]CAJ1416720.1 unnamed protein product [Effrenium voratum]